jgi:hypothetical protein
MEVEVKEKKNQKKRKKRPKVNNQKKLTIILCWLTKGQELDEKNVAHATNRTANWCNLGANSFWPLIFGNGGQQVAILIK